MFITVKLFKECSYVSTIKIVFASAKFYVNKCLIRILKRLRTTKTQFLVKMSLIRMGSSVPAHTARYFPFKVDYYFGPMIWKASKIYNDKKFAKRHKRS